jgi:hypothetical protein
MEFPLIHMFLLNMKNENMAVANHSRRVMHLYGQNHPKSYIYPKTLYKAEVIRCCYCNTETEAAVNSHSCLNNSVWRCFPC